MELIDALRDKTRSEAVAAAERLALIAAIVARHCDDEDDGIAHAVIDGWEYATADVCAACGLTKQAAAGQMRIAIALRDRLPKVGALLAAGEISAKIAAAITWRTRLVIHEDALALIDAALAGIAPTLGTLSQKNIEDSIDVWIEKFDPTAVSGARSAAQSRYLEFGGAEDPGGTTGVFGRLLATDAAILKARLTAIAATVCDADPRTKTQRLADALGVLAADPHADRLPCLCGDANCAAAGKDPRAASVIVHVLTDASPDASTDRGPAEPEPRPDPAPDGGSGGRKPELRTRSFPAAAANGSPGVLLGGGVLPAPLVSDLVAAGARVTTVSGVVDLPAEPGYRPSAKLTTWVRTRDLVCSFPGCNHAAHRCDLDHCVPWPAGATHPGNLSAKCRTHHLLKTFGGWDDCQHQDGTHTWTSPTGHTYTTVPLSRILFPDRPLDTPAPSSAPVTTAGDRGLAMPRRRRTRAQARAARINAARRLNRQAIDENAEPPPF
ncbi:HNH endonuclease [Mycolicibacterium cosmeticum]|uniref:HNH endonuclease n=1 Tax=Mycolicibacterium cosmeticum TaxID=258533 RepID=W9AZM6_MYCCO|nr:HNH endonuclease signature motif containing protein [Mycolicibacterium cosmeticum]TLH70094.1 HNH endonuclease [Mycolicibacterium cosmeticum]CDO11269.1 HNH endonuclease [Mycolicibacterium cosmeticum]